MLSPLVLKAAEENALRPRHDPSVAARLAASAAATTGAALRTDDLAQWLEERRRAHRFRVDRIVFDALDGWSFEEPTGNLVHRSGRFFSIGGLHVVTGEGPYREWHQPIISQPEVGILGLLVKEFDGVLHFLMQAKMEPGNRNLLQLSPTVQATRSNYTKVHRGADVKYIEYFTGPGRGQVITDVLQSEHGSWFFRKSNRNMIVEAVGDVPLHDDFCWLTLGQIGELLHEDNVVNMDARTVLACAPLADGGQGALLSDVELLSWFTAERSRHDVHAERVPLAGLPGWVRGESAVRHEEGRYFDVVAVSVQAGNREVSGWTQPLFEPRGTGVAAFLTRRIGGVRHVLAHARVEGGFLDTVELGPTVQYTPDNHAHLTGEDRPPFLDAVLAADRSRILYEAVHSEEGGRFLNAESRYLLVEADEAQAPLDPPPGFQWVTPDQLGALVQHGHYVNVQARTLLACLTAAGARA
ncbi:NDP-hexose 2,3-dehydratase family protein [Streptomyces globisporus]|uniref:NDP-hexose 2,3-dehydratase n=1 Tax=Streptomyces globisporus TaxID=1908 RepID=A0A068EI14_STRGL|nr:NDP-hexose 2,3-dehydratase family protein [Streptomyces globisporus]AID47008.1 NDP-hexose 2,3-dehydratase [Streptomyces globisporus]ROV69889.1 NDP-hexose 2,3-dehydratase [Streptomyces globisporus]